MQINNGKSLNWTPYITPLPPILWGSSGASPLKFLDVMPPYLKTLFEPKTKKFIILTIFA